MGSYAKKFIAIASFALALFLGSGSTEARADNCKKYHTSHSSVVVKAPPKTVYESILKLREKTPEKIKELSRKGNECVLEETFLGLPVIGKAKCVYKETYTPYKSIEYKLMRSNHFRAFEGKWTLTPGKKGETRVSLSSYVDLSIPVPFGKQLTRMQTARGVKKRLKSVKKSSEAQRVSMGSENTPHI